MIRLFILLAFFSNLMGNIPHTEQSKAKLYRLGSEINTPYHEYTPFITPDGNFLFFESDRPNEMSNHGDFDLWFSRIKDKQKLSFNLPENIGSPINTANFDGLPSLRKLENGDLELYFTSIASNQRLGLKETNIYYAKMSNNVWSTPQPLIEINSNFHDRMPSISQDGQFLFFSSNRPGGYGKDDIWVSKWNKPKKRWNKPQNIGEDINSANAEISPSIHSDKITLYFSSNRRGGVGGYDIYFTQRLGKSAGWKKPQNLGTPYNSEQDDEYPTVLENGNQMYFASNRSGGAGGFDIFHAQIPNFAKPRVILVWKGQVLEETNNKGIEANIEIIANNDFRNLASERPSGKFEIPLLNDQIYRILITAPGYRPEEKLIDLREKKLPQNFTSNIFLKRLSTTLNEVALQLKFLTQDGQTLTPNLTYRWGNKNPVIALVQNGLATLTIANREELQNKNPIKKIEKKVLHLDVELEGYKKESILLKMKDLIANKNHPLQRLYRHKIIMVEGKDINFQGKTAKVIFEDLSIRVHFAHNIGNRVKQKDLSEIDRVIQRWKIKNRPIINLSGHTDSTGSKKRNLELSKERAELVKSLLIKKGVPEKQISISWHADEKPLVQGKDDRANAQNRRVEIRFQEKQL